MRELWKLLLKLWGALAFAEKVALISALTGLIVISLSMGFAAFAYRADKEAYLFELQRMRVRSAALHIRSALATAQAKAYILAQGTSLPSPGHLELFRWPEGDELFVTTALAESFDTAPLRLLFRSANGDLMAAPLQVQRLTQEDSLVFAITSHGEVLARSQQSMASAQKMAARPSVKLALNSNLTESTSVIQDGKQTLVVAFTEIPGTNLLVFAEITMNQLMAPFYQAMRLWIIFGWLVVCIGAVLSYLAVKRIARPAKLASEYLYRIARGDYSQRSPFAGKDEFSIIFHGIDYLAQSIAQREERLKLVGDGLKSILENTANLSSQLPLTDLAKHCSIILQGILRRYEPKAFGFKQGLESVILDALSLEARTETFDPLEFDHDLVVRVVSQTPQDLLILTIFGVSAKDIWPETQQTLGQFSLSLAAYFERLTAITLHEAKVRQEVQLNLAGDIQQCLVAFPQDVPFVQIARHYIPAEQVGGDWTSAYLDSKAKLLRFFMADATGHGVAASLVTAVVAGATKQFEAMLGAMSGTAGKERELLQMLATQLNQIVLEVGGDRIGMSMIMGSLNYETGELNLLNFGHPGPIYFGLNYQKVQPEPRIATNNLLGIKDLFSTKVQSIQLSPGQGIMLFTDGLIENYNGRFRDKTLRTSVRLTLSAEEAAGEALSRYQAIIDGNEAPADDVAILAIQWLGDSAALNKGNSNPAKLAATA